MADELIRYVDLLQEIKKRIRQAEVRAVLSANKEMILLYWDIGLLNPQRQLAEGWGAATTPHLAKDVKNDMPEIKGFSERNLKRIVRFYHEYPFLSEFVPQAVALSSPEDRGQMRHLVVRLPWGHNILIIKKIKNPGMLPFGMTMDDFRSGVSKVRNRVIVRVFRELGLMEEWGSGYRRVLAACQDMGYPNPDWQELGSAFRVTFYPLSESNVPVNVPVNKRQQWFLNQLGAGKRVKSIDLAHHWNVTEKTAKRDIADLKNQGMIEFVGSPKTGVYHLKE